MSETSVKREKNVPPIKRQYSLITESYGPFAVELHFQIHPEVRKPKDLDIIIQTNNRDCSLF